MYCTVQYCYDIKPNNRKGVAKLVQYTEICKLELQKLYESGMNEAMVLLEKNPGKNLIILNLAALKESRTLQRQN